MCEDLVLSFVMFLFQLGRCVVNYEMRVGGGMARARHLRLTALLLLLEVVRAGDAVLESEVGVEEVEEMGDVAGGVVGLDVAVDVVSDLCLVCEEDCLMLLAPKSLRTFVLLEFLSWDWPLLFCLFFLLLFLFLLL